MACDQDGEALVIDSSYVSGRFESQFVGYCGYFHKNKKVKVVSVREIFMRETRVHE